MDLFDHATNVFRTGKQALEELHDISEGIASQFLLSFLELNLPQGKTILGVYDKILAGSIKSTFPKLRCETGDTSEVVQDMLRGIRLHSGKLLKQLREGDTDTAQLGLGHAYSRAKVKFSVQKNDNHIIQAIAILDHLDKAINTFSMRVREWYSWHFPELIKIVCENHKYAKVAIFVKDKKTLSADSLHDLARVVDDDQDIAQSIIDAGSRSMGQDIAASDMENVITFAGKVVSLAEYRKTLHGYLVSKMAVVAPNLAKLIGEVIGARLISHAGSLTSLAKYPASTVQILGAEKALFRALKTKGNTPKYGLLYHSSFIGRASQKNKGRISRFLANKCSIASRIDGFSETPSTVFGETMKNQVEERLAFYATGAPPTKNAVAMVRMSMGLFLQSFTDITPRNEQWTLSSTRWTSTSQMVELARMQIWLRRHLTRGRESARKRRNDPRRIKIRRRRRRKKRRKKKRRRERKRKRRKGGCPKGRTWRPQTRKSGNRAPCRPLMQRRKSQRRKRSRRLSYSILFLSVLIPFRLFDVVMFPSDFSCSKFGTLWGWGGGR